VTARPCRPHRAQTHRHRTFRPTHRRLVTVVVALLVAAAAAPAAQAQPTASTTIDPTSRRGLEDRVSALTAQLAGDDRAVAALEATLAATTAEAERAAADLVTNQRALDDLAAARTAPAAVRAELALARYIGGDPETTTFADFVRTGDLSVDALRRDRLFATAEAQVAERLAAIDADIERLRTARTELQAVRSQAVAGIDNARTDLTAAKARRNETAAALAAVEADLKGLLARSARAPLRGTTDFPARPAIGIKIDNNAVARPQTGLNGADVVYDIIVEGGITRFLAMFQANDVPRIGPVRSARTSDISIMSAFNNPIFAFSGGNDGVLDAVAVAPVVSVTESSGRSAFERDPSRYAPFNLYTSTAGLYTAARGEPGVPNTQFTFRAEGEASVTGRPVRGVSIDIGFETVTYTWNGTGWDRATNGEPTIDTASGVVSPRNVIVQFTTYTTSPADASSPDALTVGQGKAWVLTDGKIVEGRWARGVATAPLQYLDAGNAPIALTPGQTWVELPRPGNATVLER